MKSFILTIFMFYAISLNAQEKEYQKAWKDNTVKSYDKFLSEFPNSKFTEEITYKRAKKINTQNSYEDFLKKYPDGVYYTAAISELDWLMYLDVEDRNTIAAYEEYLKKFPDGMRIISVKEKIQRIQKVAENKIIPDDKIIPGLTMEEVLSILQMDESLNRNTMGGIYVGMGVFPHNANEKSLYTGDASLDGYDIVFEKGKVVSKKMVAERLGSKKANFTYTIK